MCLRAWFEKDLGEEIAFLFVFVSLTRCYEWSVVREVSSVIMSRAISLQ